MHAKRALYGKKKCTQDFLTNLILFNLHILLDIFFFLHIVNMFRVTQNFCAELTFEISQGTRVRQNETRFDPKKIVPDISLPKNLDTILMHWMSMKLADNFQIHKNSWPCLFHIICERSELFMVKNVYLGFSDIFNLVQSSYGFTYRWIYFFSAH